MVVADGDANATESNERDVVSTRWDIKCVSCDAMCGFYGARNGYGRDILRGFIEHASRIAFVGRYMNDFDVIRGLEPIKVELTWGNEELALSWFAIHDGGSCHKLKCINEYGELDGNCNQRLVCLCGTTHRCEKPEGHPPPCELHATDSLGLTDPTTVLPSRPL